MKVIMPRNIQLKLYGNVLCAFGLEEIKELLINKGIVNFHKFYVLIDGHVEQVLEMGAELRRENLKKIEIKYILRDRYLISNTISNLQCPIQGVTDWRNLKK